MTKSWTKSCPGCGHPVLWVYEWCVACETKPEGERVRQAPPLVLDGDGRPMKVTAE